jgi:hypothetical protein
MTYAIYDITARKSNPGHGFANSKRAVAFSTIEKMKAFLAERDNYDFSAKRITRREAMVMLEPCYDSRDKGLWLDPEVGIGHGSYDPGSNRMVSLRPSRF